MATGFGVGLGVGMTIGGPQRLRDMTFQQIATVPGAPAVWGVPLAVLGAVALMGSVLEARRLTSFALVAMAAWSTLFALQFARAVLDNPNAAVTGVFAYGVLAIFAGVLAGGQPQRVAPTVRTFHFDDGTR
jgi:hypothetical protein